MKRLGFLFERIASTENLLSAARLAMRGKRNRACVGMFFFGFEHEVLQLQRELMSGEYRPSASPQSPEGAKSPELGSYAYPSRLKTPQEGPSGAGEARME